MKKSFLFIALVLFFTTLNAQDPSRFGEYIQDTVTLDVYPDHETFDTMSFPPVDTIIEVGIGFVVTDWGSADGDWLPLIKKAVPSSILTQDTNGNWYYEDEQATYYLTTDTRIVFREEDIVIFKPKN